MKHYFAAAGALLLGTSTIALAADVKPLDTNSVETADTKVAVDSKSAATGWDKTAIVAKSEVDAGTDAKVELAALDKNFEPLASAETGKVETASVDTFAAAKAETASVDSFATVKAETVDTSDGAKWQTASAETVKAESAAMGGPFETASLTPRPATANYPPCDPGPGDDHCIQLYEEGVREQLAGWNRPTGGLLDNSATTAMGGPFEPVESSAVTHTHSAIHDAALAGETETGVGGPFEPVEGDATQAAMNGDGSIDALAGETESTEAGSDTFAQAEVDQHGALNGVGGPIESQSGYPACEPGPGDDRCVQLYEAGVSGAGN